MTIPVDSLTPSDYAVLKYINKFDSVSKEQIIKQFANKIDSIEYRLSLLSQHDYKETSHIPIPIINSSYVIEEFDTAINNSGRVHDVSMNSFHISPLGSKALQDYKLKKKVETAAKRKDWIRWIITTLIALAALINSILARLGL